MALIPLYEAKTYLRVDSSDEDALMRKARSGSKPKKCMKSCMS